VLIIRKRYEVFKDGEDSSRGLLGRNAV